MSIARERTDELAALLRREHQAMADFLVALSEFHTNRLWSDLGYAGLFDFLHRELGLSKSAAHYRKVAAELIRRCPAVVEPLRSGSLCFSSIIELAKVVTPENVAEVLPRFFRRSKREAMQVVAELMPVERLPPHAESREADRTISEPLTAELCRLHVTIPTKMLEKVGTARDLLSHAKPHASTGEILDAALDVLLENLARTKRLATRQRKRAKPVKPSRNEMPIPTPGPRTPPPAENTTPSDAPAAPARRRREYIPAHVRRAVWERDRGRCSFPLEGGGVCGSTYQLELDHITPVAHGGKSTVEGLRVACKPHNIGAAREIFGDAFVDACIVRRRAGGSGGSRVAAKAESGP
jgi:5-methylcytosine-specific restriction endonuclease McrA